MSENCSGPPCIYQKERVCNSTGMHTQMEQTNSRNCCIKAQQQVHRLGNLDLARNLAMCEGVNKVCYTQAVYDLPNSETVHSVHESEFANPVLAWIH